jgi:hypothetical protein
MFVVMTVNAQQLPIASIGRIVVMVMVFMVNRQFPQLFAAEFPTATGANPWK